MDSNRPKKKILFAMPLPPPMHGASAVSDRIRLSGLINDSFDCSFVNLSTSNSVDEIGKTSIRKVFRHIGILFRLLGKLAKGRYDACYLAITCHGKGFIKDFPFIMLCKAFCKKIILHQHNKGMSGDIGRFPYRNLIPHAYKDASVILLSERLYQDISTVVEKKDVFICPNGINAPSQAVRSEHKGKVRILFLSNLIASKGILTLLDALKLLDGRGVEFHCDIAGNPSKNLSKEQLICKIDSLCLSGHIKYHGAVFGDVKESLLHQADMLALPTENECFPLVVLEAMSHSLPVVTTDEGGIPDMIHDGVEGLICNKRDSNSLADALQKLIEDEGMRESMGAAGREAFMEKFTTDRFEARLAEILSTLV